MNESGIVDENMDHLSVKLRSYLFFYNPTECHKVLDLGILMDSSYTISPSIWEEEKSIVVTLMNKLDISPPGTHMSVMTFNTDVDFPIPFNGYKDADDLKRKITQLPYHTGWSRTDLGLTAVKDRMFVPQAGARDIRQVPRTLVVFTNGKTDGKTRVDLSLWKQSYSKLIHMYTKAVQQYLTEVLFVSQEIWEPCLWLSLW